MNLNVSLDPLSLLLEGTHIIVTVTESPASAAQRNYELIKYQLETTPS